MEATRHTSVIIALGALALSLAATACVSPMSSRSTQAFPLKKGDSFTLLRQSADDHPLDAIVVKELSTRTGALDSGSEWLVEYSYAIRPSKIAMKNVGQDNAHSPPQSDALLTCGDTSHRVTIRIIAENDGNQLYRGTAELIDCRSDFASDDTIFMQLLNESLINLKIE